MPSDRQFRRKKGADFFFFFFFKVLSRLITVSSRKAGACASVCRIVACFRRKINIHKVEGGGGGRGRGSFSWDSFCFVFCFVIAFGSYSWHGGRFVCARCVFFLCVFFSFFLHLVFCLRCVYEDCVFLFFQNRICGDFVKPF